MDGTIIIVSGRSWVWNTPVLVASLAQCTQSFFSHCYQPIFSILTFTNPHHPTVLSGPNISLMLKTYILLFSPIRGSRSLFHHPVKSTTDIASEGCVPVDLHTWPHPTFILVIYVLLYLISSLMYYNVCVPILIVLPIQALHRAVSVRRRISWF